MVAIYSRVVAWVLFVIGPLVPLSYIKLLNLRSVKLFGGIHEGLLRWLWYTSAVLAVIAFVYICMLVLLLVDIEHTSVFGADLDGAGDIIIAACLLMVVFPSLLWPSSVIRKRTRCACT
jgi:hypothetical protein